MHAGVSAGRGDMSPMDRQRIRKPSNPEGSPLPPPPLPSPSGDITVESQVAQGSTFTIWLPIRQDGSGVYPDEPDRALAAPHPSSSEDEDYAVPASRPQPAASKGGAVRWGESSQPWATHTGLEADLSHCFPRSS